MSETVKITSETLEKLRSQDRQLLTSIYRDHYPMVKKYILNNSGSDIDAQDIFQDALFVLIQKSREDSFTLTAQLSTYLYGISRHLWLKQLDRTKRRENHLEKAAVEMEFWDQEEADLHESKLTQLKSIRTGIQSLGEPCYTILNDFYFLKSTMQEIAKKLHYSNANHAKNQKYKCFMRLKKWILKNPVKSL